MVEVVVTGSSGSSGSGGSSSGSSISGRVSGGGSSGGCGSSGSGSSGRVSGACNGSSGGWGRSGSRSSAGDNGGSSICGRVAVIVRELNSFYNTYCYLNSVVRISRIFCWRKISRNSVTVCPNHFYLTLFYRYNIMSLIY